MNQFIFPARFSKRRRNMAISNKFKNFHLIIAIFRCVDESQRSIAIGLQWLLLRLLGTYMSKEVINY